MRTEELADRHVYRLARDVENPQPDKRATRDPLNAPVIKAGMRFVYDKAGEHGVARLTVVERGGETYPHVSESSYLAARWAAIVDALEPVDDVGAFMASIGTPGRSVVAWLLDAGVITRAQVAEAMRAVDADMEKANGDSRLAAIGMGF